MKKLILCAVMMMTLLAGTPFKNGYDIGDIAADFKLRNVDGNMLSMSDLKEAKGFIVIFDCNTCPYSKAYNERIIALNNKYATQGFPVIAINANDATESPGDSYEKMVNVSKKKGYTFPYLIDESQTVARTYGATNTPHVYVLNRVGKDLKVSYIGTIDDNARNAAAVTRKYVEEAVDALLAGKAVPTPKTKAIGCGIKWKNT